MKKGVKQSQSCYEKKYVCIRESPRNYTAIIRSETFVNRIMRIMFGLAKDYPWSFFRDNPTIAVTVN